MTMTLNIYKDEYKASHLDYLRKAFTVESETSKVVTIQYGERGDKMQSAIDNLEYAADNIQDCLDNLCEASE